MRQVRRWCGAEVAFPPPRNAQDHNHRRQPSAVESCARRMMCALWACVLIAPFAVSQCLGVADPSDGVGVKGELSAGADNAFV